MFDSHIIHGRQIKARDFLRVRKILRLSSYHDNFLKNSVPRRSNRTPDRAHPCKQHSDRALSLMLLDDFETGFCARSAVSDLATRRLPVSLEISEFGTSQNLYSKFFFEYPASTFIVPF
ncbi:hypothetical protein EFP23_12010 [Lacticaseibacillus paracasei]|nr:hypothetical protein [Lacticaseibacillus paracasei]QHC81059.1 hypothetical protein F5J09_04140 [Lacticaseibacillus paracasei]RDF81044.1 hypothetical protein DQM24_10425 [Lacticaseibacillus paracasei]TEA87020.1 hypothetical protein TE33_09165 [Lacticaseibacillus paracasei]TEA91169.1 hypothetical protein TK36_08485 [Lacticaseibacillus paracasei]